MKRIIIDMINIFQPAFRKSDCLTNPLLCMIMHVGEATTVKYANADAMAVEKPIISGSPPIFNTIGPMTAIVAALLNKLVNIPVRKTATTHRKMEISSLRIFSRSIIESAIQSAAPVSFIWRPIDTAAPKSNITPQLVFLFKSDQRINPKTR